MDDVRLLWFIGKMAAFMVGYIWLRATMPRLRYDQLMNLGWKTLLPVGVANLIVVAMWIVTTKVFGPLGGWFTVAVAVGLLYFMYKQYAKVTKSEVALESRTVTLVGGGKKAPVAEEVVA